MPVFWPGEFHGLYSPWGGKESDKTEQVSFSQWERNLLLSKDNCIYPLPLSQRFGSFSYTPPTYSLTLICMHISILIYLYHFLKLYITHIYAYTYSHTHFQPLIQSSSPLHDQISEKKKNLSIKAVSTSSPMYFIPHHIASPMPVLHWDCQGHQRPLHC